MIRPEKKEKKRAGKKDRIEGKEGKDKSRPEGKPHTPHRPLLRIRSKVPGRGARTCSTVSYVTRSICDVMKNRVRWCDIEMLNLSIDKERRKGSKGEREGK